MLIHGKKIGKDSEFIELGSFAEIKVKSNSGDFLIEKTAQGVQITALDGKLCFISEIEGSVEIVTLGGNYEIWDETEI